MKLEKLGDIKLGCLQDLCLADIDVLEGVDGAGRLFNLTADRLGEELLDELLEVAGSRFAGHDLEHLFTDLADLARLRVRGLFDLCGATLGETDGKETNEVAVGCLYVDVCLDESLPLSYEGTELVGGEVHAVEVCEAVLALYFVDPELYFAERLVVILAEVCEGYFDDATLEVVVGVFWMGCEGVGNVGEERCTH